MKRRVTAALLAGAALGGLAGCSLGSNPVGAPATHAPPVAASPSPPPELAPPPSLPPAPVVPAVPATPVSPTPLFPEANAVGCQGQPSFDQVVALVRHADLLSPSTTVTPQLGPLCAGTWQYTVLAAPGREPLQVVSRGRPAALVLVTAGTDVCSIPVRTQAPPGILAATHCGT